MIDPGDISARQYAAAVRLYRSTNSVDADIERLICEDLPALINKLRVLHEVAGAPCQEHCCTQKTNCAVCGKHKHTPLRRDEMGGYVCLTCVNAVLDRSSSLCERWHVFAQNTADSDADRGALAATSNCASQLRDVLRGSK